MQRLGWVILPPRHTGVRRDGLTGANGRAASFELCEREAGHLTAHHIVPKLTGGKNGPQADPRHVHRGHHGPAPEYSGDAAGGAQCGRVPVLGRKTVPRLPVQGQALERTVLAQRRPAADYTSSSPSTPESSTRRPIGLQRVGRGAGDRRISFPGRLGRGVPARGGSWPQHLG